MVYELAGFTWVERAYLTELTRQTWRVERAAFTARAERSKHDASEGWAN